MGAQLKPSDFVHLHNHTHHSLLDGLTKIPDLITRVKELGMEAVAVTDHGTMSGSIELYKAAKDAGIKPIIGFESYVAARSIDDRDPSKDKIRYHITLIAMNNQGYQNLMRLSTIANLEGMYYKPRIDHELLQKYGDGLIVLSGCASSEIGECLKAGNYEGAKEVAGWYKSVFGDRYYLEMQNHDSPELMKVNEDLAKISKEMDIPLVITNDGHYLLKQDQEAHEILLCVGTGSYLSDTDRMSLKEFDLHVIEPKEIIEKWGKEHPEAIRNTKRIADRCNVELTLGEILIPRFPVSKGKTEKSFLEELVYKGLAWRYGGIEREASMGMTIAEAKKKTPPEVLKRADYELSVVEGMGFNGYFLIVQDFINWGKDRGIIFGPGRGSAAGSIISYALRITELDPLQYDLLFERFLNPDRISMPDVDIDIQDTRRDEVIAYCAEKYGVGRVANIVTFGRMAARAAVRDVARVLQVPYSDADRLSKMIPAPVQGRHIPLKVSIEKDQDLRTEYQSNPVSKEVIDYAIRLEGTIRSHGVHAAGVVIAPDDIVKYVPLEMAQKGVIATQYSMVPIEELGLLKMDFLGLSNLSTINNALRIIKKVHNTTIDLNKLPLDDEQTYKLLQRGDTTGVFQFESSGMKRCLRDMKPTEFSDVIAMGALYRPGPLKAGLTDSYIKRKNGREKITYPHPLMEDALKTTFGVLVYQEQVMQISRDACGFTGGEADTLRKAIGKKKLDVMQKMQIKFVEGGVKNGIAKEVIEKFWQDLLGFADYCFNKSHSACYGLISYWTAYLKSHYPDAFMAALMTSDQNDIDRLSIEIAECKKMGITVLPPDVNEGFLEFAVVPGKNSIRFGMAAVKGVGTAAVEEILRTRDEEGKFTGVEDFAKRVSTTKFNRKAWESLIKAGGFDSLGDRSDLLFNLDTIQAFASKIQKEALSGQTDLFGGLENMATVQPTVNLQTSPARHTDRERLSWERELMGLYISSHPLDNFDTFFTEQTVPLSQISVENDGSQAEVGGLITNIRTIVTKSGSKMAFVGLEDKFGETEIIIFPNLFEKNSENLIRDAVIKVSGKINARDKDGNSTGECKIIADEIQFITDKELREYEATGKAMEGPRKNPKAKAAAKAVSAEALQPINIDLGRRLFVHIVNPDNHEALLKLKKTCSDYPGEFDVVLVLGADKKSAIKLPFRVDASNKLIGELVEILGEDCVKLK